MTTSMPSGTEYVTSGLPSTRFQLTRISPCGIRCVTAKASSPDGNCGRIATLDSLSLYAVSPYCLLSLSLLPSPKSPQDLFVTLPRPSRNALRSHNSPSSGPFRPPHGLIIPSSQTHSFTPALFNPVALNCGKAPFKGIRTGLSPARSARRLQPHRSRRHRASEAPAEDLTTGE